MEKQAIVYVGGEEFSGEVCGGKTFITSPYYAYLDRFFDCEENCKYKPEEPIIDEETGLQRFYYDEVYNRSVESLARMAGYLDLVSSWEQTEDYRIVVVNNAAKNGPYQLVRQGREVNIRLYTRIYAYNGNRESLKVKDIKPFENEEEGKEGWFGSKKETTGEDYRNYTFYELLIAGIQKWEGVYENQYQKYREPWWNDATTICYDDFGQDGAVSVKIEVCVPTGEHPKGNRVYMFDNREGLINMDVYDDYSAQRYSVNKTKNWSMVIRLIRGEPIINIGTVLLFTRLRDDKRGVDSIETSKSFLYTITHEFGHVWGLKDAYNKPDIPGWHEADKTKEVSEENIMRTTKEIQPNDIEMILEFWKYNKIQYYADYYGKEVERKSKAIRYKTKGE